jgi:hypothetical protein
LADYEIVLWHAIHIEFFSVESFAVRAGQSLGELIFMYELMLILSAEFARAFPQRHTM